MAAVAWVASFTPVAFLWHNGIGAVTVMVVGLAVSGIGSTRGSMKSDRRVQATP
jgi:hypothetical protein